MATAEEGNGGEPPGLGRRRRPRFRATDATSDMAGGGVLGGKEDSGRESQLYILALPTVAPPAAVISRLDAAVLRKARTCLPHGVPSAWWSGRISFSPPPPAAEDPVKEEEGRSFPRPQRVRVAPSLDLGIDAAGGEKRAKRLRKCRHCGRKEMGRDTICNACGVNKTGALPERRPAASPIAPLENPIWEPEVPGAIYLVRKSAAERRPPAPRTEAAPAPRPGTRCLHCGSVELPLWIEGPTGRREVCAACGMRYKKGRLLPECPPAARPVADSPPPQSPITNSQPESPIWEPEAPPPFVHLPKKISKKKKKKQKGPAPWPKDKGKTCLHCGTSETPQWREGPKGRGTLCNACGVRYKQGGLLPEYRPVASPTFLPSQHANLRRKVLQLHLNRQDLVPVPVNSVTNMPPIRGDHPIDMAAHTDEDPADTPGCTDKPIDVPSSLDSLLLDGPSAPLIVESDEFLIS
uniref:Uncharacterized protein n=1 Tax=Avena sativa TaxID=4498 RepID=A0ACD5XNR7_AVESA